MLTSASCPTGFRSTSFLGLQTIGQASAKPSGDLLLRHPNADQVDIRFSGLGDRKSPTETEEQIVRDFWAKNPLSERQRHVNRRALADYGLPVAQQHPILLYLGDPEFLRSAKVQALKPTFEEMTSPDPLKSYLDRILGKNWETQGEGNLYNRKLKARPLMEVVTNAIILQNLFHSKRTQSWKKCPFFLAADPIKLYARALNLDAICGSREAWAGYPQLLCQTVKNIDASAKNLDRHFGDRWKIHPAILMDATNTINQNQYLCSYLGLRPGVTISWHYTGRSTQFLSERISSLLRQNGCVLPGNLTLPLNEQESQVFNAYLDRHPRLKFKLTEALAIIRSDRLLGPR